MMATELANLRRARSRCHFRLKQAEDLAQSYRDKLASLEFGVSAPWLPSWNCRCGSAAPIRCSPEPSLPPCAGDPTGSRGAAADRGGCGAGAEG